MRSFTTHAIGNWGSADLGEKLAKLLGLKPRGTLAVLLDAQRDGQLQVNETKAALEQFVRCGFRVSEEVLFSILRVIESGNQK